MHQRLIGSVLLALCLAAPSGPLLASRLENQLERELRGAWAVLMVEGYSDCSGFYNNNDAGLSGVTSKAGRRFTPGELVKIDKINLKRSSIDLFLSLGEPVLISRIEGPFELFDERECKIQLKVDLGRAMVKAGLAPPILEYLSSIIDVHGSAEAAGDSIACNGREREPYPEDYELTLARYAVWQAEQINAAVADRIAETNDHARSIVIGVDRDHAYLDGFAAGIEEMRSFNTRDCSRLVDIRFASVRDRPSGSGERSARWKEGYSDGQELLFNLLLADRLQGCFVPVPPAP